MDWIWERLNEKMSVSLKGIYWENAVKSRKMGDLEKETDRLFWKKLAKNGGLGDNGK